MKIALISDIHGTLPALEAVLVDIDRRGTDRIFCLGDILGKGPSSKETLDLCRARCETILMGNWEHGLYQSYLAMRQGQALHARFRWFVESAGEERMEYVGALPHSAELVVSGQLIRLFHAHPQNFNRYFADSPIEQRRELFGGGAPADVAVYADIHEAYLQMVDGRQIVNTGSVGNPLDVCLASYVLLEGEEHSAAALAIQFVRVPYDIGRAVALAKRAGIPDLEGYISELETAEYFRRV